MRYQVTFKESAVVTISTTVEVEAESEEAAKKLVLSDEWRELPDEDAFFVDHELSEIHSSEMLPTLGAAVARVG